MLTFQDIILKLQNFWAQEGCAVVQPVDLECGAGTFHRHTYLRVLGPEPWRACYVQPSRRPTDGRYGENPNRLHIHHQFQVVMKPSPIDIQARYLRSLEALGLSPLEHDVRFVEDDWESPTLGAWGLGWEVWVDGMEVTQFTYFQQAGGIELAPVAVELTYGLERLAMYLQNRENVYDLVYSRHPEHGDLLYGAIFRPDERAYSHYNFEYADRALLLELFNRYEAEALRLLNLSGAEVAGEPGQCHPNLATPAYDYCLKCSHVFNLLDARGAISVTERQGYILRVRTIAKACAHKHLGMALPA